MKKTRASAYVVCIKNNEYEASLERRKIYRVLEDAVAERRGLVRVVDESRESYLYPEDHFLPIKLERPLLKAFAHAA